MIKVNEMLCQCCGLLICAAGHALVATMAKEIERKFLVEDGSWRDAVESSVAITQFYLAISAERSIRIRISDGSSARLTLKFGSDQAERDEFEYAVPLADAEEMKAFATGVVIRKTRHHVRHRTYLYEVDVFAEALDGLVVAELETPDRVPDALLPAWLGREVTGELRFSNASLALNGFPEPVP
jgi:CYTH domain-containing protein